MRLLVFDLALPKAAAVRAPRLDLKPVTLRSCWAMLGRLCQRLCP